MKHKCLKCDYLISRSKQEYCRKHSPFNKGEYHYEWKGGEAGYDALHDWITKEQGRARDKECAYCGSTSNVVWANVSREYKRELDDWIPLCTVCHFKYDRQDARTRDYHGRFI